MNTPTCCGPVIENWALNKKFYVCTECKKEVTEAPSPNAYAKVEVSSRVYPTVPTPISVEEVSTLSQPWDESEYPFTTNKDDYDNG